MKQKVILAFSGGLDTSFCVLYLKKKGFEVVTLTVDTGGLSSKELMDIKARSKELGATKHISVEAKKEIFDDIISNLIKANALYQGVYPNMCADRYTIAKYLIKIAKKEKSKFVAHGCTGAGNDQVRIDVLDYWDSEYGGRYPNAWALEIPEKNIRLEITPVIDNQELITTVRYWEGAVDVRGMSGTDEISGRGYVELTGYAE